MDFVNKSVPYQPISEIHTDLLKRIRRLQKSLVLIGISLAVLFVLVILIIVYLCVSTRTQLFPIGNNIQTTVMVQDFSTTTVTTDTPLIKVGQKFGNLIGGEAFDDSSMDQFTSFDYIRGIILQSGTVLNWIQCFYSSNSSSKGFRPGPIHGIRETNDRGKPFFLDEDERISKVEVKLNKIQLYINNVSVGKRTLVIAIRFFTTKGRSSPDISQAIGDSYTEEYPGYTLGYIAGRSGQYIDQVQFYWYQTTK